MRVLVAPDSFGGALPAAAAAAAVRAGWLTAAPDDDVRVLPLTDGGVGFVGTMHAVLGGELLSATVRSPLGDPVPAAVLVVDDAGGRTAYVEAAQAVGPALVPADRRDPGGAASLGVGDLLRVARGTGAGRVVVGLGDAATNDAGAGMLAALGLGRDGALTGGGRALGDVTVDDLSGLGGVRGDWAGVQVLVACATDLPLLGLHGTSAGATEHGATALQAQELERALGHFAHAAVTALGPALRPDLLASARPGGPAGRLTGLPGAGSGGGLGFGLALLGARLLPGAALVADAVDLAGRLADVDLAVTGAGTVDWRSLHDAVVSTVADRALAVGVPTVVVAGQVLVGRRELATAGITAAYPVAETDAQLRAVREDPATTLAGRAARVARTWSR